MRDHGFVTRERSPVWLGLLAVALIAAATQTYRALEGNHQLDALRAELAAFSNGSESGVAADHKLLSSADESSLDAIRIALLRPWEKLLDTLAKHAEGGIRLHSVEPDAAQHSAEVTGSAPGRNEFLNYLVRLRADPLVASADPVSDSENANSPATVDFKFRVSWVPAP